MSWFEQHAIRPRLRSVQAYIFIGVERARHGDAIAFHRAVLHHHHRIGAPRHGSSGHDLHCFARPNFAGETLARAYLADDRQIAWQIRSAHSKSIAHRARNGRVIAIGPHLLREHSARGFREAHLLDGRLWIRFAQLG